MCLANNKKKFKKFKTEFVPVDSEHFSIWSLLDKTNKKNTVIDKIYITASGGPFRNLPLRNSNLLKKERL